MSTDVPHPPAGDAAPPHPSLPDDLAHCQQMILELVAALRELRQDKEQLQHRLDQLLRRLYGPRAEKFDPNQPWLFPELSAAATAAAEPATMAEATPAEVSTAARKKNGHGRRRLPDNLPRIRQTHDLSEAECACPECGSARLKIGEEISEQLDYQPASLFVIEHVCCTYACPKCQSNVTTADKPAQPIDKGLPGPGLLAQVITSKYDDHLPLYRLERIFERHGLKLPRSSTCDWMARCAELLLSLYLLMKIDVLRSRVINTDDTTLPVQDDTRDKTRQGRLWTYLGDFERPYNVFDYTPNHARDGPQTFLRGFCGFLQADAFSGYDGIYAGNDVIEVGCNAHARRKFFDARSTDPQRAHTMLAWYRSLFDIERNAKEQSAAEELAPAAFFELRRQRRQEQAVPILTAMETWLRQQQPQVLPKSPIAAAINYALNHWQALTRYTSDGMLDIDNNVAEREMKRIAIGRKNWLFVGSDNGGNTAAVLCSFTSTCRRHGIDPFTYLRDVLGRLPTHSQERLEELLPDRWKAARQAAATPAPPPPDPAPAPAS